MTHKIYKSEKRGSFIIESYLKPQKYLLNNARGNKQDETKLIIT